MKTYLLTIALLTHTLIYSQGVGINNDGSMPANSAVLDVKATDKGLLIPRVNLNDTDDVATITSPDTSLFVYNTNINMDGGNGVGMYSWSGSKWIKLIDTPNGPGNNGDVLTSQGPNQAPVWKTAAGGGGGCLNKIEIFDTPGSFTWTRPAGVDVVYVTIVGAGGGGGGGASGGGGTTFTNDKPAGTGGGGGQSFFNYPVAVSGNVAVTIGSGGTGGTGGAGGPGSSTPGNNGTDGGDSSFGTLTAKGGKGGCGGSNFSKPDCSYSGGGAIYDFINTGIGAVMNPIADASANTIGSRGGYGSNKSGNSNTNISGAPDGAFSGGISVTDGGFGGGASSYGSGGDGADATPAPVGSNGNPGYNASGFGSGGGGGGGGRDNTGNGGNGASGGNGTAGHIIVQWSE